MKRAEGTALVRDSEIIARQETEGFAFGFSLTGAKQKGGGHSL